MIIKQLCQAAMRHTSPRGRNAPHVKARLLLPGDISFTLARTSGLGRLPPFAFVPHQPSHLADGAESEENRNGKLLDIPNVLQEIIHVVWLLNFEQRKALTGMHPVQG